MQRVDFELIAIIANRKAEFYRTARERFLNSLPNDMDKKKSLRELRRAIARLDNMLFVSDEERAMKMITPNLPVRKLGLHHSAIVKAVVSEMARSEPAANARSMTGPR